MIGRRGEEHEEDGVSGFRQYTSDFHGAHSAGALHTGRPQERRVEQFLTYAS